jgi:hypothetical protein
VLFSFIILNKFEERRLEAPEARVKIARSFNCGFGVKTISSPSGAAENVRDNPAVPAGTLDDIYSVNPAVEIAGYFRSPLCG